MSPRASRKKNGAPATTTGTPKEAEQATPRGKGDRGKAASVTPNGKEDADRGPPSEDMDVDAQSGNKRGREDEESPTDTAVPTEEEAQDAATEGTGTKRGRDDEAVDA